MSTIKEKLGSEQTGQNTSMMQVALASWIGTCIEWYDFYGTGLSI